LPAAAKHPDGSVAIDLLHPLVRERHFAVHGSELTPLHVPQSEALGAYVTRVLASTGRDLFVRRAVLIQGRPQASARFRSDRRAGLDRWATSRRRDHRQLTVAGRRALLRAHHR
jgi:hypothetical protein